MNANDKIMNKSMNKERQNKSINNISVSPNPRQNHSKHLLAPRLITNETNNNSHSLNVSTPKNMANKNNTISINVNITNKNRGSSINNLGYYELPVASDNYSAPSSHNPLGANLKKLSQ